MAAYVLHPWHPQPRSSESSRTPEAALEEAVALAGAIDLEVYGSETIRLNHPNPATLLGGGKVEELQVKVEAENIQLVIVDHPLSPVQQRNLEQGLKCKVIDRTGLILEIFGARASTAEGQLQVELAALDYQRSRLVRSWTHLERQRGGFGFLGGPGESQLEIDRRLIEDRIARIKKDLEKVRQTRGLQRAARVESEIPLIALVGYTNAGKSTLFNLLTDAGVLAKDMLFATLDPTMRQFRLPSGRKCVLSDTVGFISDLPHQLVEAFRATLEEVEQADIILHVRDAASNESEAQRQDVEQTLGEIGIDAGEDRRIIEVLNKMDLVPHEERPFTLGRKDRDIVPVSAASGEGIEDLLALIERRLSARHEILDIQLAPEQGEEMAWLYQHGQVLDRQESEHCIRLHVSLSPADAGRYRQRFAAAQG